MGKVCKGNVESIQKGIRMSKNLLFVQLRNLLKRMKYVNNWYSFYFVYFKIIKKTLIKFKNGINCEISVDNTAPFYFIEQFITDKESKAIFLKNKKAIELLGKSDFIFEYGNHKYYIKKDYEIDSLHEIFQNLAEPQTYKIFSKLHGELFINVGSNAGGYAIPASKNFKRVICLEPNPKIFYELNKNMELNKIKNTKSLNVAAWSRKTKLKLFEPKDQNGYGGGISTLLPKYMEKEGINYNTYFYVNTITLNELLKNQKVIDLLLIDAENAEVEILRGSDKILDRTKAIIIEVRNNTEKQTKEILKKYKFKITDLDKSTNSKNIFGFK